MAERELWQAVIRRARWDARGQFLYGADREETRAEVAAWIETPDFDMTCTLAGLSADDTRRAMRRELRG